MRSLPAICLFLCAFVSALPNRADLGVYFENGDQDAPLLKLDYGTYRGFYNATSDVYVFKNIRFAAPPVGDLRWAKPAPPGNMADIQDGSVGRSCVQSGSIASRAGASSNAGEDCLFLDLTVPSKAIKEKGLKLPVVNWIYGGAYIVGSKEQRGGGDTMIKASKGNLIWVAGNYRLGAYGFLAGTTVEQEGTPNTGFYDQRAVLKWIQDYIPLVGGDPNTVTAMGISAGAGSILHHLIFQEGEMDTMFTRAIIQSPGYTNFQDRAGQLEQNYKRFEDFAGCSGKGLTCLRALDEATLKIASDKANSGQRPGSFAFGPAPDGKFIGKTPGQEFDAGHYFKGLEAVISSHVTNEGGMFTDSSVTDDDKFDAMLLRSYGNQSALASARDQLKKMFPAVSAAGSPYKTEHDRLSRYVTEMSFTCHNRLLADAYRGRVYSVQYAVPPATHGSDQTGTFFNPRNPQYANLTKEELEKKQGFQSYLVSFAVTGNPNKLRNNATTIEWPLTTGFNDTTISNVLDVESLSGAAGMKLINDPLQAKDRCAFWTELQKTVQKTLNY